jgi:hypothetical protein
MPIPHRERISWCFGNFDVNITIDKDYILGGTGYLQNPNQIGFTPRRSVIVKTPKGKKH